MNKNLRAIFMISVLLCLSFTACGKSSAAPHSVEEIQISDEYLSRGYDVYKVVAFPFKADDPDRGTSITREMVNDVLDYYQELYRGEKKVKVMIYHDPSSAVQAVSKALLAELEMEGGKVKMRTNEVY
jgi:hypothetical protein